MRVRNRWFTKTSLKTAVLKSQGGIGFVVAGSLAAFLGEFIGYRLLGKITMRFVKIFVGIMLLLLSAALEPLVP